MQHFRSFQSKLAISAGCWLALAGCDTGAVGVDSCRNIEYARCSAATHCPATFALKSEDSCKRFYRDHCLHGLPLGSDPGPSKVNTCVSAIDQLGECAAQSPESQDTPAIACFAGTPYGTSSNLGVCQLLAIPEAIEQCSFLGSSDAGTSTGGANAAGGATSSGGAPDTGGAPNASGASSTGGTPSAGGMPSTATTDAVGGSSATL